MRDKIMQTITQRPKHFRTATSLKSINITTKEWFDRVNGNSYFASQCVVNGKFLIKLPYQYGYGDHAIDMVCKELVKLGLTDKNFYHWKEQQSIAFNSCKIENCLKRDVISFGNK